MSERQRIVATGILPVYRFVTDFDCLPPTSIFEIHAVAIFANLDHRRFQK